MGLYGFALTWALAASALQDPQTTSAPQPPPEPAAPAESSTAVSGVTVTAAKPEIQTSIDRRSYSVANDLQGQTGSIADVLRNIPSVQVDLQGNLSLRGDSGVTVLLDGQPSGQFRGDSLAQALQSLPANRIERIEVITNPSAQFRTDGSGGIINLITRKATGEGRSGSVNALVGHHGGYRLSLSGGYNSRNLRLTGDASFARQIQNQRQDNRRTQAVAGGALETREVVSQDAKYDVATAHLNAEYDLDARTRLSGDLRTAYGDRNIDGRSHFELQDDLGTPMSVFDRRSPVGVAPFAATATTTWRRRYGEGHDLTLVGIYDRQENAVGRLDVRTTSVPPGSPELNTKVFSNSFIEQSTLRADYSRLISEAGKLKLGYELNLYQGVLRNDSGQSVGGAPVSLDPAFHDRFEPDETRNDAYVTFERPVGKLTVLAGLRWEWVQLHLNRATQGDRFAQDYADFYPTLHLEYGIGEGRRLTGSYSRRINRPTFAELNPYLSSASAQIANQGNANLRPENTDSFEIGYERRSGPTNVLVTGYYRRTDDAITTIGTDLGNGLLLGQRANAGAREVAGVEVVRTGRFTPKVTYNVSANLYWTSIEAPGLGFTQERSATAYYGRANLNWQATPKDFFQLNVFANSKVIYPQGYSEPVASGNIGYRHKVNDRLSWMVVAQDPFGTMKAKVVLDAPGGKIVRRTRTNSRLYTFSIVRTFGRARPRDPNFDFAPGGSGGAGAL